MRLTAETVAEAEVLVNALKQRTLVLRNLGVVLVENLGTTRDQFECIDLSDNEIHHLCNLPKLTKLKSLILANNKISTIAEDLPSMLPNLESLVLTNNRITSIDQLKNFKRLERISLSGNPIAADALKELALLIPSLKYIDGQRVASRSP